MMKHSILLAVIAVLLSLTTLTATALPFDQHLVNGQTIDIHQFNRVDPSLQPIRASVFDAVAPQPVINPPAPFFSRDLSVEMLRVENPAGNKVGSFITLVGVVKNNGMFSTPLSYSFFLNGANLGPAVPQPLNQFWDGVVVFLAPGESRVVVHSLQLTAQGETTVQLKADPFNLIQESRETNNARTVGFVVQPADQPAQPNPPAVVTPPPQPQNTPPASTTSVPVPTPAPQTPPVSTVTRSDARTTLRDADSQCTDASNAIDNARSALNRQLSLDFTQHDIDHQNTMFKDARKLIRDANDAYDHNDYVTTQDKADSAQKKCERIVTKVRFTEPFSSSSSVSMPQTTNTNYANYVPQRQSTTTLPQSDAADDVQLVKSGQQASVPKDAVAPVDDTATPLLIASVIVGAFLVLGELGALAYFAFKK